MEVHFFWISDVRWLFWPLEYFGIDYRHRLHRKYRFRDSKLSKIALEIIERAKNVPCMYRQYVIQWRVVFLENPKNSHKILETTELPFYNVDVKERLIYLCNNQLNRGKKTENSQIRGRLLSMDIAEYRIVVYIQLRKPCFPCSTVTILIIVLFLFETYSPSIKKFKTHLDNIAINIINDVKLINLS